jgi:hypothetical protein
MSALGQKQISGHVRAIRFTLPLKADIKTGPHHLRRRGSDTLAIFTAIRRRFIVRQ